MAKESREFTRKNAGLLHCYQNYASMTLFHWVYYGYTLNISIKFHEIKSLDMSLGWPIKSASNDQLY